VLLGPGAAPNATADFDGDGLTDASDGCPTEAAPAAQGGCLVRPARLSDGDGDGIPDGADACPATPRGAVDVNADGCPDPAAVVPDGGGGGSGGGGSSSPAALPRVEATLGFSFKNTSKGQRLASLVVKNIPSGATVRVTCTDKHCPSGLSKKKAYTKPNAPATLSLARFIKKPFKSATTLTVTVSKPGMITAVKVFKIHPPKAPVLLSQCQAPGATKPSAC
jgi:hypothetical protein